MGILDRVKGRDNGGEDGGLIGDVVVEVEQGDLRREFFGETTNIRLKTDLNPQQVVVFASGMRLADHYGLPTLRGWIEDIMECNVSKGREGRREVVSVEGARARRLRLIEDTRDGK